MFTECPGEGSKLPSGEFDVSRLHMQKILEAHDIVETGRRTVQEEASVLTRVSGSLYELS